MKKLHFKMLCTLALLLLGATVWQTKSAAQITAIYGSAFDSTFGAPCAVPFQRMIMVNGQLGGSLSSGDFLTVEINYGDGTTSTDTPNYTGSSYFYYNTAHTYTLTGTFTTQIIVHNTTGIADTFSINSDPLILTNSCATLHGQLYIDADGNASFNTGDTPLPYGEVLVTNTGTGSSYYAFADTAGVYHIDLPTGYTYTVTPANGYYYGGLTVSSPAGGIATVNLAGSGATADFGMQCNATYADLSVQAWAWNFRPGYDRPLYVSSSNGNACLQTGATITLLLDSKLSYDSTSWGVAPTVTGGPYGATLTWNVASLSSYYGWYWWSSFWSDLEIYCNPSAAIGDSACITVSIMPTGATIDSNLSNNTYTACFPISNSMDPNEKAVFPRGTSDQGFVAANTPLDYLISFQNEGNDVAYNVTIVDQLDSDLDPASITVLGSSSPVTMSLESGVLKFRFNNINLPAAAVNEPGSHGYVRYKARMKSASSAPGTVFNNTANIYFDFNDAIVTNTTKNTIQSPTGVQQLSGKGFSATVAPNPASESFKINVGSKDAFTATLTDMTGRVVSSEAGSNGAATVSVHSLSSGMYLLQISNASGRQLTTKISVQH